MSFSKPTNLGIIACPGGEKFADEITIHLKQMFRKKFEKKTNLIAKKYGIPIEEVIRQGNLISDLQSPLTTLHGPVDEFRPPSFRIPTSFTRFANGEFKTEILTSIRGMDIFIIQDVANHYPLGFHNGDSKHILSVNDQIMCLLVTLDAVLQAGAGRITIVTPMYPYSRQHKKKGREGLTASRYGKIIEDMGVAKVLTFDIHSKEIEHSFNKTSLEDLHASYQIMRKLGRITNLKDENLVVVSPDTGAVDRNKFYAVNMKKSLALIYKERDYSRVSNHAADNNITNIRLLGDVSGKNVFMADDMIGTGGTLIKAMKFLRDSGAKEVICGASLPLFNGGAIEHFDEAYEKGYFHRIIGTNAVFHDEKLLKREWYVSANVSPLFARAIFRLHNDRTLSPILDNSDIIQRLLNSK